ncbi:MAG: RnfABCDGE type electron transport complex subunit G [Oscillospiraceae bacterium]|nr:RnfABCDGE type electron transport complex subunit G [Oscillospiraceae bacterium]
MENTKKTSVWPLAKLVIILAAIAIITGGLLALINEVTKDTIAAQNEQKVKDALNAVLVAETYEPVDISAFAEDKTVTGAYVAKNGENVLGHCIEVAPNGFGGPISMIVGIDPNGAVTKVAIVNMSETSGIGTKTNDEGFLSQYSGHASEITASTKTTIGENEISAITGATVSSKAVTSGVNTALQVAQVLKGGNGNA